VKITGRIQQLRMAREAALAAANRLGLAIVHPKSLRQAEQLEALAESTTFPAEAEAARAIAARLRTQGGGM